MRRMLTTALFLLGAAAPAAAADAQVTIYNRDFALIKETRAFDLKAGVNETRFADVTALLEPDSVVLRDLKDPGGLRIVEQNYEADPLSEESLLRRAEGKVLRFRVQNPATGAIEFVNAKVIRAGHGPGGWSPSGRGSFGVDAQPLSPIVEIDGKTLFALPGQPLFDTIGPDAILRPTLLWRLQSERAGKRDVEVSYLTGGLRWEATYNLVAAETGDAFDLVGWVTIENESGAMFENARVKLMAGDVSKVEPQRMRQTMKVMAMEAGYAGDQAVTERAFDEYHLYTLKEKTTLRERELKQVEFCRANALPGKRLYVYDGANVMPYGGYGVEGMAADPGYGTQGNTKVATMIEFKNSKAAGLGIPLPKGTMKLYRADTDGGREFIGENSIDHTPVDETVRLAIGNAFDLKGERRQTDFRVDNAKKTATEAFEIKVRNHKKTSVEVRVVEHLYRWSEWKIGTASEAYDKKDARTIEFVVLIPPDGEKVITYRVNYSW
ncbi:MAG TPA: DUF4139 domain-containing protein [Candidatus Polarisedimenticolia bacterium]|nr:DUF4139 domain-containing protein [Candidatus Polarisedimenticolia bacterium]